MKLSTYFHIALVMAVFLYLLWLIAEPVEARSPRESRILREVNRIEQSIRNLQQTLDWIKSLGCGIGIKSLCPYEPVPETPIVSKGHTLLVKFDVTATRYNPVRAQTDASPCQGWAGDVCMALERGENVIAASQDIAVYPLGRLSKVKLESRSARDECQELENKVYTVMDTMSACLRKNKDLRTGRCNKPVTNAIDILTPCEDDECLIGIAKARAMGVCPMTIIKL